MHIPQSETLKLEITPFLTAMRDEERRSREYGESRGVLRLSPDNDADYDRDTWLYIPDVYGEYRYILGTRGERPLICIGVNPSTAAPGDLDPTLKSVSRIAAHNGFDSWIMFNLYAQRATRPDDMDVDFNERLHEENMAAFRWVLERAGGEPALWAAWGAVVEKRQYLFRCVNDMVRIGNEFGAKWYRAGKISLKGHPHHPLYLKKDEPLVPYAPPAMHLSDQQ